MDPGPSFTFEIQSTVFFYFLHFLQVTFIFHTIRLILCDQQAGEIDNLTVTLGQSFWLCCAGVVLNPTGLITLVSFLRENLLLHSSYLPLRVSKRTCALHVSGPRDLFILCLSFQTTSNLYNSLLWKLIWYSKTAQNCTTPIERIWIMSSSHKILYYFLFHAWTLEIQQRLMLW